VAGNVMNQRSMLDTEAGTEELSSVQCYCLLRSLCSGGPKLNPYFV
jgi:hypothetical protein